MEALLQDLWTSLRTSGPLVILLFWLLLRVDGERRRLQDERDALLERTLTSLNNVSVLLDKWQALLSGKKDA